VKDPQNNLLQTWQPGWADVLLAIGVLMPCFFFFHHGDLLVTGWSSLNYLFGPPHAFYESSKVFVGDGQGMIGTGYLPPIYVIFALVLYPLKLLGLITGPEHFPLVGIYTLKALITAVYLLSGWVFYRLTGFYSADTGWRKFTTAVYLTSPILIFTQFVFSQFDIFYVVLTLAGFGFMLQRRIFVASLAFGLAITFKSFPALVFLPLLLFVEKRFWRLAGAGLLFVLPFALLQMVYSGSPAFVEGVTNNQAQGRIFTAGLDLEGWTILFLFSGCVLLCGWSYLASPGPERFVRQATFIYLAGSILPFLFVNWHPQWLVSVMPAIVLTSMTDRRWERFLILDLVGMAFYIATTVTFFSRIDHSMFHLQALQSPENSGWSMGVLLGVFGDNSASVYASLFWGYLVLQLAAKANLLPLASFSRADNGMSMAPLRLRFYGGLGIFIVPFLATLVLTGLRPLPGHLSSFNEVFPGELSAGRVFEQTISGQPGKLRGVSLFLGTFRRENTGILTLELIDSSGVTLDRSEVPAASVRDNSWTIFPFREVTLQLGAVYTLRLQSPDSVEGNAVTWWASRRSRYAGGEASVDGSPSGGDFALRLEIDDQEPNGK
jgi:hypothetical protein